MKQPNPQHQHLDAKQQKFADLVASGIIPFEAAKQAGYSAKSNNAAGRLMRRPVIKAAIERIRAAADQQIGKRIGNAVKITRNDIINGLAELAKSAESDSARVSAYSKLADIFGLSPKTNAKDTDLFAGWTDEELDHYRRTGELPARFGPASGPGEGDVRAASPATPAGE